jgi:hypothetical protein
MAMSMTIADIMGTMSECMALVYRIVRPRFGQLRQLDSRQPAHQPDDRENALAEDEVAGGATRLTDHKWTVAEMLEVVASYRLVPRTGSIIDAINAVGDN